MSNRNRRYLKWLVAVVLIAMSWSCSSPEKQAHKDALKLRAEGKLDEALQVLDEIQTDDEKLKSQIVSLKKEIHQQLYNNVLSLKSEGKFEEALQVLDKIAADDQTLQSQIVELNEDLRYEVAERTGKVDEYLEKATIPVVLNNPSIVEFVVKDITVDPTGIPNGVPFGKGPDDRYLVLTAVVTSKTFNSDMVSMQIGDNFYEVSGSYCPKWIGGSEGMVYWVKGNLYNDPTGRPWFSAGGEYWEASGEASFEERLYFVVPKNLSLRKISVAVKQSGFNDGNISPNLESSVQENQEGVIVSYDRLPSYMTVQGKNGIWGPPEERIKFGEDYGNRFAIIAQALEKKLECPVVYQDVAYLLDSEGKRGQRIAILGYKGCPFSVEADLEAVKDIEMREEIRIEIDSATGSILWVSPMSARPFSLRGIQLAAGCEMLRNVVWFFKKGGIAFNTRVSRYLIKKPGATIRFTKDGVIMDGVQKIQKIELSSKAKK